MKFRVLSDLHVDYNDRYPFEIPENGRNVFTVLCGDTSGGPETTIEWIKANVRRGVFVSGNHLPYCNHYELPAAQRRTMDELRKILADKFPADGEVSYLDAETGAVKKVVDGIMFLGSCCYTDMGISDKYWNPEGRRELNRACSEYNMNDYKYGYTRKEWPAGYDNEPSLIRMTPKDYEIWFANAIKAFEKELSKNEASPNPLPVVLITHHPLIADFFGHNGYVEDSIWSIREFNWASYASDWKAWLKSHASVKCYCCGHIHAVEKEYRHFSLECGEGRKLIVVNNARGYVKYGHDFNFNMNLFVDTDSWEIVEEPFSDEEKAKRGKKQ